MDLRYLLTRFEFDTVNEMNTRYEEQYGQPPEAEPDLCYFLGDAAERQTWSASNQQIPCFRMNAGFMYFPHVQRWMTPEEKLAAMGMPCVEAIAENMCVPTLGVRDVQRSSLLIGNAMNLANVTMVQLVALTCFAYKDFSSSH
jgi:hypothetical protein